MREIFPEAEKVEPRQEGLLPQLKLPSGISVEIILKRMQHELGDGVTLAKPDSLPNSPYLKPLKESEYFRLIIHRHTVIGSISRQSKDSGFVLTFVTIKPEIMTDMELPKSD